MDNINWTLIGISALVLVIAYLIGRLHGRKPQSDIPTDLIELYKGVQELPARVLQVLQGSINPQKGRMAELLTYAELRYDYDRIIPLGQPIDFIEVKSGLSAVLSEEEKQIKNLIAQGRINFRLLKVTDQDIQRFVTARKGDE